MSQKGDISYDGKNISTQMIERVRYAITPTDIFSGSIPCGPPDVVNASVEKIVGLPSAIFGRGDLFILRAQGDSMIGAGIDDGDLVVVDRKCKPVVGNIVVALDGDHQNTLKTLMREPDTGTYYLHPENPALEDIYVDELSVQGVAQFVIKKLKG